MKYKQNIAHLCYIGAGKLGLVEQLLGCLVTEREAHYRKH